MNGATVPSAAKLGQIFFFFNFHLCSNLNQMLKVKLEKVSEFGGKDNSGLGRCYDF